MGYLPDRVYYKLAYRFHQTGGNAEEQSDSQSKVEGTHVLDSRKEEGQLKQGIGHGTSVFQKLSGDWKVTHEHLSFSSSLKMLSCP
ncbi:nuclear transport factor 2 family protein [Ktedonospora formicarum]|uniref:nuclear transport factor 2 family protein n=1 Tax=Ktedonospora formicarum TaxID=2778364 RepID=UPI003082CA85